VIEHVKDPASFVAALAARLAPCGLMILSTPNRTLLSKLGLVRIAEGLGRIPRGTHDWDKFVTPEELTAMLSANGLKVIDLTGLSASPAKGFVLSDDVRLDYFVTATEDTGRT
jgi:2-polyprenyl-6-hydroxyphenyl methylase / 3-demethylubiquinone-9 3-methyltransferase